MSSTALLVKNMVCHRCILAVEDILQNESIPFRQVIFGEIRLPDELSPNQKERLIKKLGEIGFELIVDNSSALIEKIKQLAIKRARNQTDEKEASLKLPHYITASVNQEYTYLSSLFSSIEGRTIENYFKEQKIEREKELMVFGQLTLSQIAFDLEYCSVAHLSARFKKITGLTPSFFKTIGLARRKALDKI